MTYISPLPLTLKGLVNNVIRYSRNLERSLSKKRRLSVRRQSVKVLLVYPANQLMSIETPRPDGSLGPLYLASALESAGYETDVLDASVGTKENSLEETFYRSEVQANGLIRIGMNKDQLASEIARGGYDVVGISSNFTPQTRLALEVAEAAKIVSRDILVIAGGVNARNLPTPFFRSGNVDAICLSEGERVVVRLIQAWQIGIDLAEVPGVITERGGLTVCCPVDPNDIDLDLDQLPFPAWHKLPFQHYDKISSPHGVISNGHDRYAPIMTSRGCPFRCKYCHISVEKSQPITFGNIGSLRLKSIDRVFAEIDRLKNLGVSKIYFEDDSLLAKKDRVRRIFSQIKHKGLKIADVNGVNLVHFLKTVSGGSHVIDVEYLELLADAGFDQIVFPVESASQRILNKYATGKLNHEHLDVVELVKTASKIGITCPVNIMIGFPDETEEEIRKSIELGRCLVLAGAAYCTFFIPIPFPGSQLYEIALKGGHIDPSFDPDLLNWKNAVMRNTTVSPERVLELRDWGWRHANTDDHVRMRLETSIGSRWSGG